MNVQLNAWWSLPVVSLVLGLASGYVIFGTDKTPVLSANDPVNVLPVENQPIAVVDVALPPAAVEYQPQLTAKLVNNQVVVSKGPQASTKSQQKQPAKIDADSVLAQRFSQVLADMQDEQDKPKVTLHPQPLTRYPQWYQSLVPPLEFSEHIYSSKPNESRVRVNNQVVKEGELIDDRMRIVKIEPQQVVIQLQERQFTLPALSSW